MTGPATDIVVMDSIDKSFPGVHALNKVSLTLTGGEIHALVGENGAGKSTLVRILTGAERQDGGTISLDGAEVDIRSPLHAQSLGISTVYQEVNLCPNLTVAENLLIGRQPTEVGPHRLEGDEPPGHGHPARAGRRDRRHPPAGLLLDRDPADGGHCPGPRHLVGQGARARRADVEPHGPRDASSSSA